MNLRFALQTFARSWGAVRVRVMIWSTVLTRSAVGLLLIAIFIASSGHAQNIISLDSASSSATAPSFNTGGAVTQNSGGASIFLPGLPPRLAERLRLDLGLPGSSVARQTQSSPILGANRDHFSSARKSGRPAHRGPISRKYFVTDFGTLGGTESFAYGINDAGQAVGFSRIAGDATTHSFLYSNGRMTDLYPLNSTNVQTVGPTSINDSGQIASGLVFDGVYSPAVLDSRSGNVTLLGSLGGVTSFGLGGVATSINNLGEAVGYAYVDATNRHAFLYFNGLMTDIGSLGGHSEAFDVNDAGTIVGSSANASNDRVHAFVYSNGAMRDIDPFSDATFSRSESTARSINNRGQIVGEFLTADGSAFHAFLYRDGVFYDLGFPESPETVAFAINDNGQVVGVTLAPFEDSCFDPQVGGYVACINYVRHAFVYEAGDILDLNALIPSESGWELAWAFDINNHGQIVGYGLVNDKFRAFVLVPADSKEQCKKDGWKNFGFKNQGQCIKFVNTGD